MNLYNILNEIKKFDTKDCVKVKICIISNIGLEPYLSNFLKSKFLNDYIKAEVVIIPIEEYNLDENVGNIRDCDMAIVWLNFEHMFTKFTYANFSIGHQHKEINSMHSYSQDIINTLASITQSQIIWIGFEDYYLNLHMCRGNILQQESEIDVLNRRLLDEYKSIVKVIDLKRIIGIVGLENTYNLSFKYKWNTPYTKKIMDMITDEICKHYLSLKGKYKKCVVIDCDNVLWGGVVVEDGIENIKLGSTGEGRKFQEFQRFLLSLYNQGIILAICSKNASEDVTKVFKNHDGMVLEESHIAYFAVNWNNKIQNIITISEFLNIGLENMIFIDDSDFEINLVKEFLPEITTILFDSETIYERFKSFNIYFSVDKANIDKRNLTYKSHLYRKQLLLEVKSEDEYIKKLQVEIKIKKAIEIEYTRIAEITQRTNKFTNGKRYEVGNLLKKVKDKNYNLFSVYVRDKYSDLGLTGCIGIDKSNNEIDIFCLSCRAAGRKVENRMVEFIKSNFRIRSVSFEDTTKNQNIKNILDAIKEF